VAVGCTGTGGLGEVAVGCTGTGGGGATAGAGSAAISPAWIATKLLATHPCAPEAVATASQPGTWPSAVTGVVSGSPATIG
jgi:hypothetical protein